MKKLLFALFLLLLNTSLLINATAEPTNEDQSSPRYSIEQITKTAKTAWQNKWVKFGVATITCATLYKLGLKYNIIALPSFLCAVKAVEGANEIKDDTIIQDDTSRVTVDSPCQEGANEIKDDTIIQDDTSRITVDSPCQTEQKEEQQITSGAEQQATNSKQNAQTPTTEVKKTRKKKEKYLFFMPLNDPYDYDAFWQ